MQGVEPYGSSMPSVVWPALWLGLLGGFFVGRYLFRRLRQRQALQAQHKLTQVHKEGADQLIAEALEHIAQIRQALLNNSIDAGTAAEQLSGIGRVVTDAVWNHRTMYRTHDEIAQLRLTQLAAAVGMAYPLEFDTVKTATADPLLLCEYITEVVKACR